MADPRVANLARTLVHYCTEVKPGEQVGIISTTKAAPLVEEIYKQVLGAGGHPHVHLQQEELAYHLFTLGNDEQVQEVPLFQDKVMREYPVLISIRAATNTRALTGVDPARQALRSKAMGPMLKEYRRRSAEGELRWVITLFPTHSHAQDAEMGLTEFEDYVYGTTYSNAEDPVKEWNRIHDMQQRIVDHLAGKKHVVVKGPNADLKLSIEGRKFINSDGKRNMPSGEVFTSPVDDSADGWIRFTYPAIREGREVDGIELHFEQGMVVKATAEKNQDYLLQMLDIDEGARRLGEFAIGTNKMINRFIKNILFDEKIGGTIHLALGASFAEAGGVNQSAIHWDMICDMRDGGTIHVDDELIYDSGEFKV
ncbi:MAG TPA: aminopeptidase [Anaerolineae bacterium]|nr:aminopeptidase [Anaerolineae bacterium]